MSLPAINFEDSRGRILALTTDGKAAVPDLTEIADRNDLRFFGCLSTEEQGHLRILLEKLTTTHQWNDIPVI